MKKLIFLTIFVNLLLNLFAQTTNTWIQDGSEWHHKYLHLTRGYMRYYLEGETVVDGVTFQQVKGEYQTAHQQPDNSFVIGELTPAQNLLFYTSNDSVFIRKPTGLLQFIWHQNPQVGDVWDFGEQYDEQSGTTLNAYAIVENVQPIEINGIQSFNIFTTPCLDEFGTLPNEQDVYFTNLYAQQINTIFGPLRYFQNIGNYYLFPTPFQAINFEGSELLCFESTETPFYQLPESIDCYDGVQSLSNEELDLLVFDVYPNPAKHKVHFSGLQPNQNVSVYSSLGQIVSTFQGKHTQTADVGDLASGLYYYRIFENNEDVVHFGKFIKE